MSELIEAVVEESGYGDYLRRQGDEGQRRLGTLDQLRTLAEERFDSLPPTEALQAFLEYLSLAKNADRFSREENRTLVLTIHAAKGMEFDTVIITGAHDGSIPASWTLGEPEAIDEERRLLYVGMTRAKKSLELVYPMSYQTRDGRMLQGRPSRFLTDAPSGTLNFTQDGAGA